MNSFACKYCGTICQHTRRGYVTGCDHYPPDVIPPHHKLELDVIDIRILKLLESGMTHAMVCEQLQIGPKQMANRRKGLREYFESRNAFQLGMGWQKYKIENRC